MPASVAVRALPLYWSEKTKRANLFYIDLQGRGLSPPPLFAISKPSLPVIASPFFVIASEA